MWLAVLQLDGQDGDGEAQLPHDLSECLWCWCA